MESGLTAAGQVVKDPQGSADEEAWATLEDFKSPGKICILKKWLGVENGLARAQSGCRLVRRL